MPVIASVFALVLLVTSGRYGYHRDELYFLAAGRRLDWSYPDQPPLSPFLARLMAAVDPDSLCVMRLLAIAAATFVVVCAGLLGEAPARLRAQPARAAAGVCECGAGARTPPDPVLVVAEI